jgi:hypothetical protein
VHIEEVAALEEAEDAALEDGRECGYVIGGEVGGLVEAHLAVDFGENAVEDHEVEVEVRVEGGAETVEEGDGTDLRVEASAGTAAPQGGADGAEQDPEHGPGEGWVVMEEGADPLGDGEHPLADRQRRQESSGTAVFLADEHRLRSGGDTFGGVALGSTIIMATSHGRSAADVHRNLAHERVHVLQHDFLDLTVGQPLDGRVLAFVPGGERVGAHLSLGLVHGLFSAATLIIPYEDRPNEVEAFFLSGRYGRVGSP